MKVSYFMLWIFSSLYLIPSKIHFMSIQLYVPLFLTQQTHASYIHLGVWASTGMCYTYQGHILEEYKLSVINSYSVIGGTFCLCPFPMLGSCLTWAYASFLHVITTIMTSNVLLPYCVWIHWSLLLIYFLWLLNSFFPYPTIIPESWEEGCDIGVIIRTEDSMVTYSLPFGQLRVSVLTINNCKK